jgi:hypothetical protein
MPYNIPKLDLDITGTNINNRIVNEPHNLGNRPNRSAAPLLGPFFGESVIVMDGATVLTRGTHYQIVELHQEASLLYGKEISSVVLVTSSSVSSNITITYQALGGHFAYSDDAIANVYESVMTDVRPVSWENIFNKPTEYPPTIHRHLLDDVFGFEPVVDVLERIKRAITIGQVDVIISVLDNLLSDFECKKIGKVFPINKNLQYDHFLYFVTQNKLVAPVSVKALECTYRKGGAFTFYADMTSLPPNTPVYWEFYNPNGIVPGVVPGIREISGVLNSSAESYFSVYIPVDVAIPDILYLGVRLDPNKEDYDAVTYRLRVREEWTSTSLFGVLVNDFGLSNSFTTEDVSGNDELRLYYSFVYSD